METKQKVVLILGAASDVAKEMLILYYKKGYTTIAASRSVDILKAFVSSNGMQDRVEVTYFDAAAFSTHGAFYNSLKSKPNIVVYAAGYLVDNIKALADWEATFQMMKVHYCGAVSILNIVVMDSDNHGLEQIIGLSSLSGVRGRKSNFIYGSTKSAFTQYLAGLRQYLFPRKVRVHVVVAGYIRSKMTSGLKLREDLMLEPSFIARETVNIGKAFIVVPGMKWKIIYNVLRLLPENLAAKLP